MQFLSKPSVLHRRHMVLFIDGECYKSRNGSLLNESPPPLSGESGISYIFAMYFQFSCPSFIASTTYRLMLPWCSSCRWLLCQWERKNNHRHDEHHGFVVETMEKGEENCKYFMKMQLLSTPWREEWETHNRESHCVNLTSHINEQSHFTSVEIKRIG